MSWTGNWIGDHVVTPLAVVPFHLEGSSQHSALKVVATSVVGKEGGTTYYVRVRNDGPDATNFYVYIGGVAP